MQIPSDQATKDPYAPDTLFRCDQGHGVWRRDQLPTRRGSLVCPVGLRQMDVCGVTMKDREPYRDGEEDHG